jgi:hypothetical protein
MNVKRAISSGVVVWTFASIAFAILGSMEATKNSLNLQASVVGILIVPFAIVGAYIYFKNGNRDNGLILGTIMAATALALDALITVPFLEMPNGGSYQSFYAYPELWILATVNLATVYLYWMLKVKL